MPTWKVAGVQMDCRRGDVPANLAAIRDRLRAAAGRGARLIAFPECALSGYCFDSLAEAWPTADTTPGPATADELAHRGEAGRLPPRSGAGSGEPPVLPGRQPHRDRGRLHVHRPEPTRGLCW